MKRSLLLALVVVLGIAVTALNPLITLILAGGVWIYLVRMVRRQERSVLNDQMAPTTSERHLGRLKALLIVAGLAFLVFVVGAIVHNATHGPSAMEQTSSFLVALVALGVFVIATAAGMALFLTERQRTT